MMDRNELRDDGTYVDKRRKEKGKLYTVKKINKRRVQELLCYDFCIKEEGPEKEGGKKGYLTFRSR